MDQGREIVFDIPFKPEVQKSIAVNLRSNEKRQNFYTVYAVAALLSC